MNRMVMALALMAAAGAASAQQTVYAIGNGGTSLIRFQSDNPADVEIVGNFSGDASFLDALDFRPATGQLYGYLDMTDSFYTVDLSTGSLTLASSGASAAATNTFVLGIDFNPTIDRARIVTESGQNIVFNPIAGTAAAFTSVFYASGDVNENVGPLLVDNAYTNNFAGATTSQQYAIDHGLNALVTLANNSGVLQTVGPLGVNTDIYSGFDIFTGPGGINTAYAILTPLGGTPSFYTIDLATGQASLVGAVGFTDQVYSLAVIPSAPTGTLLGLGAMLLRRRR